MSSAVEDFTRSRINGNLAALDEAVSSAVESKTSPEVELMETALGFLSSPLREALVEDFTQSRINGNMKLAMLVSVVCGVVEDFTRSRINGNL